MRRIAVLAALVLSARCFAELDGAQRLERARDVLAEADALFGCSQARPESDGGFGPASSYKEILGSWFGTVFLGDNAGEYIVLPYANPQEFSNARLKVKIDIAMTFGEDEEGEIHVSIGVSYTAEISNDDPFSDEAVRFFDSLSEGNFSLGADGRSVVLEVAEKMQDDTVMPPKVFLAELGDFLLSADKDTMRLDLDGIGCVMRRQEFLRLENNIDYGDKILHNAIENP